MLIIAEGKAGGLPYVVKAEQRGKGKVKFYFNDRENPESEKMLKFYLDMRQEIGNYIPEVYEDLNIYNVLENNFPFDSKPKMTAEGVKTLPWQKGVIY